MNCKAAIFDLDGTLLDTLHDLAYAGNSVLMKRGFPQHPVESYKHFVGDGLKVLMERITPADVDESEIQACCSLFNEIYDSCWDANSRPYPGIIKMLHELKSQGIRCSVLSNKPHQFTRIYIDRFFNSDDFEVVFGQREGVEKKPDPAGAIEIANIMQVDPAQCIYVGDTSVDMRTGKSAGMYTIGVLWGFREKKELQQNNADIIVSSPEEIVEYVLATS
ncbi:MULTISPECIES: HAD family hydrolase [Desulfosediminicola]|uniref:HAD family hydrolase n=1 Tax=Desulfosediminicola TaxID=2886823 RepID=UPI0010ABC61A|nr:HAD family hydrolase [Desulfosediminicola ganghwensis]